MKGKLFSTCLYVINRYYVPEAHDWYIYDANRNEAVFKISSYESDTLLECLVDGLRLDIDARNYYIAGSDGRRVEL